ncbi:alpha-N-acetylgalactosaminide alpha-2,6-sialyltransferase 1 isoform X1 [Etheostoma spectabile]|uniref:alpha-N-acetylgalactosaminide alpha-2,6-sialyltransferase 1 isoform X1 n=2 Tax=Etheostoma spectabile TaxID=54343 RepID=UPI0013AE9F62|nr:alpha-N-acetylgalactosaminide alpha-2,6-sialyltransferase 1 isoform X1 [Etheostoma spectabile]
MAVQTSSCFSLLLVISVCIVLFFLSWGQSSSSISWTTFSTPPPVVFTHTAKKADSTKTKLKTDQMSRSTLGAVVETPMPVLSKASFKKLPQWDFDDVYNQDVPPRQTTCTQSLRKSEVKSFRKAFLPNIRLFLYKDSINMSEWNRLSHFNNPFGFMEYKYDDVMASVKLIPKPKEPLLLPKPGGDGCVHCAVVGNAGILNGSKMGKEIDSHDYVFRMNGAVTKGYEEDVGNRTSVYIHTAHSITSSLYFFKKFGFTTVPHDEGIKYVMVPEGMRDFNWLEGLLKRERIADGPYKNKRPWTYYAGQYNETRFYVLHQDFLRYVRNRFLHSPNLNSSYWAIIRPSNGAFTLFLALHTCDTVNAYGFMTEDYNKYSTYYFEKNIKTPVILYANHDYMLEKNMWKTLHDTNIIKLYQRSESEAGTKKPKQH